MFLAVTILLEYWLRIVFNNWLQDLGEGGTDKLKKELDKVREDKKYLEKMVDRLNKEMEARINNIRNDSKAELINKDEKMKTIYGKASRICCSSF